MKITATQLRNIIREEVKKASLGKKNLSEAMTRITEDEVAAWKNGDWGYVSGDATPDAGHDHQEFLHGSDEGHPHDDEGYMVKSRMTSMKQMAEDICTLLDSEDQLPAWVQDLVAKSHGDLQHVHDYLMGDEEMKSHQGVPASAEYAEMDMPVGESRNRKSNNLNEAHARVTQEEMRAWMRGDWGFISESSKSESDDDLISRVDRSTDQELLRQNMISTCQSILQSPNTSSETIKAAYNLLTKQEKHEDLVTMLRAKGLDAR